MMCGEYGGEGGCDCGGGGGGGCSDGGGGKEKNQYNHC